MTKLPVPISFDWDKGNIEKSWKKHKVNNKETEEIFFNKPIKFYEDEKHSTKEKRFLAYGITKSKRKLTAVFTIRTNTIRVISIRDMNTKERRIYEEKT